MSDWRGRPAPFARVPVIHSGRRPSQIPVTRPGDALEREAEAIAASTLAGGSVVPPGLDISSVRIHTGDAASRAAHALNANAYAIADDVVLGGAYSPGTAHGRRLLAHELAHVHQQRTRGGAPVVARDGRDENVWVVNVDDLRALGAHVETDTPSFPGRERRGSRSMSRTTTRARLG